MKKILFIALASISALASSNLSLQNYFNDSVCDQILNNGGYFKTYYDYKMKGALYVSYTLDGSQVNVKNIKKRPRFYEDRNIPKRYRSHFSDFTRSGYDRGHIANDASFDYSLRSQLSTYVMSNIIPQVPSVNSGRNSWMGLERFGRTLSVKMGSVDVLNGVVYSKYPKRIGRNRVAVPVAYWKVYSNDENNYQRCFYFENKEITDSRKKIRDYEVDCRELLR
jgi:endonuclease G